jgi:hypothetical protein
MVPWSLPYAQRWFKDGQRYRLVEEHERSTISHDHEFAWLESAWGTLPDRLKEEFPSPEHLRKWALIKCGYCTKSNIVVATAIDAKQVALWAQQHDEYALVTVVGNVVTRYVAMSQSKKSMDKATFQKSKQAIMDYIEDILEVQRGTLQKMQFA